MIVQPRDEGLFNIATMTASDPSMRPGTLTPHFEVLETNLPLDKAQQQLTEINGPRGRVAKAVFDLNSDLEALASADTPLVDYSQLSDLVR